MKTKKLITTQLSFLEDNGFRLKHLSKNSENEFYYSKDGLAFEFVFDTYAIAMDVVIDNFGNRTNIFESELFSKQELADLKTKIKAVESLKDLNQLISVYGNFIREKLINLRIV